MLIQPDRNELGDKRLDPKENVIAQREKCLEMAARKRIYRQDELEDYQRAFGPRLSSGEMVRRLSKLIPTLKFLKGSPGNIAVYAPRGPAEVQARYYEWYQEQEEAAHRGRKRQDRFFLDYKYVGGFPEGCMQEYTTIDIDNANLGTKEHRSWRTVLMGLIQQGLVSFAGVVKEFGDADGDRRGWRWNDTLRKWRNTPSLRFTN